MSWASKKQPTVALSTLEAEYLALSFAIRHVLWIRQLLLDVGLLVPLSRLHGRPRARPFVIGTDNLAAVALSLDLQFHGRSKHIDIRHHFVQEVVERGQAEIRHVGGETNPADILTKALPGPRFERLRDQLLGREGSPSLVDQVQDDEEDLGPRVV